MIIPKVRTAALRFVFLCLAAAALFSIPSARAYSVLSHEEVVDMAWKQQIVPLLKARYPGITDDEIRQAHAYAYGGSVIQDIGYYPFGSKYFSDLLHYVRPNEFVSALIRDSKTPDDYAFALGALAHYCGDTIGHPFVNQVTSDENPKLRQEYGTSVTYYENPTAHLRTEFGFDVVMVAHGAYSQENYRDFIGFQVSKPLLEQAFLETYGIPMGSIITHEDLAISTYRHAVSSLIPTMTKVAFVSYKNDIEKAAPGTQKEKFIYRLNQTEYRKDFGKEYTHVGIGGQILAFVLRAFPKVGPFKALKVSIPNPAEQDIYLKSVNETVDKYKLYLAQIHAAPAPLPPPDPKDVAAAQKAAAKLDKDVKRADTRADKAKDPADKAMKQAAAVDVQKTAVEAKAAAVRTQAKVEAAQADPAAPPPGALPVDTPIQPPTTPVLAELDMDTGKPTQSGEYKLADETYAHLLDDLVKPAPPRPAPPASPAAIAAKSDGAKPPLVAKQIDLNIAKDIEHFFAHTLPHVGPPPSAHQAEKEAKLAIQVKADLATLKTIEAAQSTQHASLLIVFP